MEQNVLYNIIKIKKGENEVKKFILISISLILMFSITGCSKNTNSLTSWQGILLGILCGIYAVAYFVAIAGYNSFSEGVIYLGYIMAGLACGVALVLYGIIYGLWWIIIIAIVLFVVFVIVIRIVDANFW